MSHKHYTKDELFILAIYDMALSQGDALGEVDRYAAGLAGGVNPKAVDAIGKLLLRANFIKKGDENFIYLTPHGVDLVNRLKLE